MKTYSSRRHARWPVRNGAAQVVAVLLAVVIVAPELPAATGLAFPPPHSAPFVSREQEVQLGQQAAQQARQQYPVISDSDPLTQYVRQLGQRLAQYVPEPRFPYEFHVVNQKDINAFALPGGPVFVNVGAIVAADNEAQLAGVMAHEMSHVYMRHAAAQASKQMMAQLPLGILGAVLGNGTGASLARLGASVFASGLMLRYSRDAESEADAVGSRIMYLAGYNPQALAQFFEKLERQGSAAGPQFLSDHPNPGNRAVAIQNLIRTLPARQYQQDSSQFREMKQLAMGLQGRGREASDRPRQGSLGDSGGRARRDDIAPSSDLRTLNHNAFQMQYPANWQVFGDQSTAVTIAPQAGVAQDAIAYGVMIQPFQPESRDLDGAFHELEQSLRQSNPNMRVVGHDESIRINGMLGKSVDLIGISPLQDSSGRPLQERDWLVGVPSRNGDLIYLVFVAPDQDFGQLRVTFEQMLRSFRLR